MAVLLLMVTGAMTSHADDYDSYLSNNEVQAQPLLLPAPIDTANATFAYDFAWWVWGNTMRTTPRGEQASWESLSGIERMRTIYSDVLGVNISESNTPAIYRLMSRAGNTGASSAEPYIQAYPRKRPYVLLNEPVWGEFNDPNQLQGNGSYPSLSMSYCWSTALALAQAIPILQDTILRRGMEYGISSVITGAHWQSDVEAATLCAMAAIAKARNNDEFLNDITAAQEEYMLLKGLSSSQINGSFPVMTNILDNPPTTNDYYFIGDLEKYWAGKHLRETERGQRAKADNSMLDSYLIGMFDECSSIRISQSETPNITFLITTLKFLLNSQMSLYKKEFFRRRPYSQFKENYPYGGYEWGLSGESSYPSRHAFVGWGIAIALAEVMTRDQNAVLLKGLEYGESQMITGMCYASDAHAARIMATCTMCRLRNEQMIDNLIDKAKKEYQSKSKKGDVNGDGEVTSADITALYSFLLNNDDSSIVNGDQDGDGVITSSDVTTVYSIILGV